MRLPNHRRSALVSLLLAGGLTTIGLLGGCGSQERPGRPARPGASTPAGREPATTRAKAQASSFARAVNLTPADVPGFTRAPHHERNTPFERQLERQLRRCTGAVGPDAPLLAEQSSAYQLKRGILDLGVSSEVSVARTPSVAAGELLAIRSSRVQGCFSRYLDQLLRSTRYRRTTLSPVSISTGTPPAPGATGSFGWRIVATFAVSRVRLSLYVDMLGFVIGPARVTLISSGALRPLPALIQQRLFALLLARASANAP